MLEASARVQEEGHLRERAMSLGKAVYAAVGEGVVHLRGGCATTGLPIKSASSKSRLPGWRPLSSAPLQLPQAAGESARPPAHGSGGRWNGALAGDSARATSETCPRP